MIWGFLVFVFFFLFGGDLHCELVLNSCCSLFIHIALELNDYVSLDNNKGKFCSCLQIISFRSAF